MRKVTVPGWLKSGFTNGCMFRGDSGAFSGHAQGVVGMRDWRGIAGDNAPRRTASGERREEGE